jgi:hypothetical protein
MRGILLGHYNSGRNDVSVGGLNGVRCCRHLERRECRVFRSGRKLWAQKDQKCCESETKSTFSEGPSGMLFRVSAHIQQLLSCQLYSWRRYWLFVQTYCTYKWGSYVTCPKLCWYIIRTWGVRGTQLVRSWSRYCPWHPSSLIYCKRLCRLS